MSEPVLNVSPAIGRGPLRAILLALPMLLLTAMMMTGGRLPRDPLIAICLLATWVFLNAVFFLMLKTGRTDRYRSILYVAMAVGFVITFIPSILEARGSAALTEADMIQGDTPFCHLVIPMILIPAALTRTVIFPGTLLGAKYGIMSMVVLWLGATLVLGRAWCSWVCFYGGLDECFSRLPKKPRIKRIDRRWTYLPIGVLLAMVLLSAATLSPAYCEWLCPFKAVTEFVAVTSVLVLIQTVIFVVLFLGLVIILPILTKRRTQCGLFCPMGPLQSLANKINVFEIRIDREKCRDCRLCLDQCPTFSLDEQSVKRGRTLLTCTKCGRCVDACPRGAAYYHIKGTALGVKAETARLLFLYPAFLFLAAVGGGMIAGGLWRLLKLVTTGSMI